MIYNINNILVLSLIYLFIALALLKLFLFKDIINRMHVLIIGLIIISDLLTIKILSPFNPDCEALKREAKKNLTEIKKFQDNYKHENGKYLTNKIIKNINMHKIKSNCVNSCYYYDYYCNDENITADIVNDNRYYENIQYAMTSDKKFTCIAIANLDGDKYFDIWTINDEGKLLNTFDDCGNSKRDDINKSMLRNKLNRSIVEINSSLGYMAIIIAIVILIEIIKLINYLLKKIKKQ